MSPSPFFEQLFEHARQITPYLDGKVVLSSAPNQTDLLYFEQPCSDTIQKLYEELKRAHPEAGAAYWLTRTWTLLCWQPIYVAFVAIYACRGLPELRSIGQTVQTNFISGFQFADTGYREGKREQLINAAGEQLKQLFDFYRDEMNQWVRVRPGFTNHLFADGVLACLVKLSQLTPELTRDEIRAHAKLWLNACGLPEKLAASLKSGHDDNSLKLIRTSCCLVYKCQGRKLCADCPRHPDNKQPKRAVGIKTT